MNQISKPFQKIVVAYDESAASHDALNAGIDLCKLLDVPLETITVIEPPPAYTGLVAAVDPVVEMGIEEDRRKTYEELMESAVVEGRKRSVQVSGHLVEGEEVKSVL